MKKHNLLLALVTLSLVAFVIAEPAFGASKKKNKAKKEALTKSDTTKKESRYDKLFSDKKRQHIIKKGLITAHKYDDKIYLEIDTALFNREMLLCSVIEKSSDVSLAGMPASKSQRLVFDRTDSMVLLRTPQYNLYTESRSDALKKALELSQISPITESFPIEAMTNDSTAVVINATSYFAGTTKAVLNLRGRAYGDMLIISGADVVPSGSFIEGVDAFQDGVSVLLTKSVKLTLVIQGFGLEISEKPTASLSLRTSFILLPEQKMKPREADPRIGINFVDFTKFEENKPTKESYFATRRNLANKNALLFYIDTLIKPSWRAAIEVSAAAWNKALAEAGCGEGICIKPYPADSTFMSSNPTLNTISFGNNVGVGISSRNLIDPRTGEIISSQIIVPRNFASTVRRGGVYQMADVDARFRGYYIPEDLICEGITADMLPAFGKSLGLSENYAGSYAYSPEQLRSAEFTQRNGITASVMDDVTYNFLARPGDKERGVALVSSQLGAYDKYAIHWLYAPIQGNEKDTLNRWIVEKANDNRYLFARPQTRYNNDPRCSTRDLGNDPIESMKQKIEHLKYVVQHGPEWFTDDDIPNNSYTELFPDYLFLELYYSLVNMSQHIGGMYLSDPHVDNPNPTYRPVSRELQGEIMKQVWKIFDELEWVNANQKFTHLGGDNPRLSDFFYMNMPIPLLMSRLLPMGLSVDKAENPYTQKELLGEISAYLFKEVVRGKSMPRHKELQLPAFIGGLINNSMVLKSNYKKSQGSASAIDIAANQAAGQGVVAIMQRCNEGSDMLPSIGERSALGVTPLYFYGGADIETTIYNELRNAQRILLRAKARSAADPAQATYNYMLFLIDRALKKN